jgi:hypothetical protein
MNMNANQFVTSNVLRTVARNILPFYKKIAYDRAFSMKWAKAVRVADLATMLKMFHSVNPLAACSSFSANGIGYFIDFPFPKPIYLYTHATSLLPGTAQFTFESTVHCHIAKTILPLYREMIRNKAYLTLLTQCIRSGHTGVLNLLIRSKVTTERLVSIEIRSSGMWLGFRYPMSKFVYYHQFFRDRKI